MPKRPRSALLLPLLISSLFAQADSSLGGQSGLIQMPDARIGPDGTWRLGYNQQSPYRAIWSSISLMPWLEASGRFTRVSGVKGFAVDQGYGDYGDKAFAAKLKLHEEEGWLPSVVLGIDDFEGTGLFSSQYLVASKQIGPLDVSLGYGKKRIDGAFGGVRYALPFAENVRLVAEYEANNYANAQGKAANRKKGVNVGVEYKWGWLNGQLSRLNDGTVGANLFVSVPLNQKEFIPKFDEPAVMASLPPRPTEQQWHNDTQYRRNLLRALSKQDFRDIRFNLSGTTLQLSLTNTRISKPSRIAGRAARIALAHAPFGTREIVVTIEQNGSSIQSYEFTDTDALSNYFNGSLSREKLARTITIRQPSPNEQLQKDEAAELLTALDDMRYSTELQAGGGSGELGQLTIRDTGLSNLRISPKIGTYFNDPSGVLKYDLYLHSGLTARLARNTFVELAATATVLENVSTVTQASNSELPHVRSDIADYKRDGRYTLSRAVVNQYFHLDKGLYGRASAGLYEEMYGGVGGQVLYQPDGAPVSFDLAVDWLKQRGTAGDFRFRDYKTTTAIASLHYRIPSQGITATVRAGRFLARDEGARFEMSRRFQSGVEVGAWYTVTNGHDITSPGTPSKPYRDKGIFMTVPLNIMLTRDTAATGSYGLSPWTRDVGQMVNSPGDIYSHVSRYFSNREDHDGLVELGDHDDNYPMQRPTSLFFRRPLHDFGALLASGAADTASISALKKGAVAGGMIWLASRLDDKVDRRTSRAEPSKRERSTIKLGNALPWAGLAVSGALATYEGDDRLSRTAYSALQAGLAAGALSEAGKWAFGRARPSTEKGHGNFDGFNTKRAQHSFPSSHVAVATAVVTPFAQEYNLPGLYVLPGLTQYARLRGREHWFSDVMAGSMLGYAVGNYAWEWNRKRSKNQPSIQIGAQSVNLSWDLP
ncbi:phosphatase PAP2 family protein [Chitinimonas arctica]|uniref:Phosphatase PAP2 family protein n=1 Tax=Chitinimonas arctica TaxID=2594795 RepID=A0A516SC34_9NEIS|nr:YjbH domain-containing protein [Chitinimonas arctica]QDQ25712.1 phosphatase PAP2 family protein [Chitinimonas arctica]